MKAGELCHFVTIVQPTSAQDSFGAGQTYINFWTGWVKIEVLAGQELLSAQQLAATVDHKVTMRYVSGIVRKMRLQFNSRTFYIEAVLNLEEKDRELHLLCREIV